MAKMTDLIDGCKTSSKRAVRWESHPAALGCPCGGELEIVSCERGKPRLRCYAVTEFPASGGRGFVLTKPEAADVYNVFVADDGGFDSCDCEHMCWNGRTACCHIAAMRAVLANGWLPSPMAGPEEPRGDAYEGPDAFTLDTTCPACGSGQLAEGADGGLRCETCGR